MRIKVYLTLFLLGWLVILSVGPEAPLPQPAIALPEESRDQKPATRSNQYGTATRVVALEDRAINESSGIVASRTTPGMYWTHNDSGDGPFIYAFDDRGHSGGVWRVTGAKARDWEGIAAGSGPAAGTNYLYIGDIGDNGGNRSHIIIYRVPEPVITAAGAASRKSNPQTTESAETFRFRYPDGKHDAETLLVHPVTGKIYIITKVQFRNSGVYQADPLHSPGEVVTLARVGEIGAPTLLGGIFTGGDISPDGLRVALCDYVQGYEIVLPKAGAAFDRIWKQPLRAIALGQREQGEAIGYRLDGKALLATSEGTPASLIQVVRR